MIDESNQRDESKLLAYKVLTYMIERGEARKDKVERELIEANKQQLPQENKQEQRHGVEEPPRKMARQLTQEELNNLNKKQPSPSLEEIERFNTVNKKISGGM